MKENSIFPTSPYDILEPKVRLVPSQSEHLKVDESPLLPPLVKKLRQAISTFRASGYDGATDTSKMLMKWWFSSENLEVDYYNPNSKSKFYFCQREAVETLIYLTDVVKVNDKFDLIQFDSTGRVSANMFVENWPRYVVKMATGTGKTKVLGLSLVWSYFHKMYESESSLARNFLIVTPNIIVLDRLAKDFEGLKMFRDDGIVPPNGYEGRRWADDFDLTLHKQGNVHLTRSTGNIFLSNVQRVYEPETTVSSIYDQDTTDYFLGESPKKDIFLRKGGLLSLIQRVDELVVLNDEAHHIHNSRLAWFQSIEKINSALQSRQRLISFQLDVTATPKHENGSLFVQIISDYPLVEAVRQNVVKHPIIPDSNSRRKLKERSDFRYSQKYKDYIQLGVIEWKKAYQDYAIENKKAVLFVMTDNTKNCDDVARFLETTCVELQGSVLVIHTKANGEISDSAQDREKLEKLRTLVRTIDSPRNPYKAVVSVMMLKEGWDVTNVSTIVGLRPYTAKSKILPEQTLGRGLRKVFNNDRREILSIIGTDAFIEFVESIKEEGVEFEYVPMGTYAETQTMTIEVDWKNVGKNIKDLDIHLPTFTPCFQKDYHFISLAKIESLSGIPIKLKKFIDNSQRKIVFRSLTTGEQEHITILDNENEIDSNRVIKFFAKTIVEDLKLVSGYAEIYRMVKQFVKHRLFGREVDLLAIDTIKNLAEPHVTNLIIEGFKTEINKIIIRKNDRYTKDKTIKLSETEPRVFEKQNYLESNKCLFNKIIFDSNLELEFSRFLDSAIDVVSFAKNYFHIGFRLDYVNTRGIIAHYYPDFFVETDMGEIVIVETKGMLDVEERNKIERLKLWCNDINKVQNEKKYNFVFVEQVHFESDRPSSFRELIQNFRKYK